VKLACSLILALLSVPGRADDVDDALKALKKSEPTVEAVQAEALKSFGVHPDRVSGLRSGAAWKAAVPTLEVSGGATGATIDDTTVLDEYDPNKPWVTRGASGNAVEVRTTLAWDLPRFVYNPEELDVARLASVQRDVISHVTQVYYARRRLQLQLLTSKAIEPAKRMAHELRIEELTAVLSGLTGGWFGRALVSAASPLP
jgi:hypothetical protein